MVTLAQARRAVATKTDRAIERETAQKWATYAVVCYERAASAKTERQRDLWISRAEDYAHEALEHGALVGDRGRTVGKVEKRLGAAAKKVGKDIRYARKRRSR